ncbi:ABC transporter substrate-binding protein [Catellatospora bangladeshensis]|uniref:ABC transporter substrate-binding protein n=1 Tax=Catellatospora bangladeshensis TaxID=310355 RepID=A0A8J3JIJ7_9ACTN|nr:ABC transporter substrate-binding protein [Catellatospora bangladeshensis]GIF78799.1 ABC transporter substrate-binding protein [Catellatospora bangladeshensis]
MNALTRRGVALAAAAALLTAVAACSDDANTPPAEVPGVSATEILVGSHMPLTGPAAAGYSEIAPASKAYFDYVNANGGVHGRKINYKFLDDGYNPANTQTVVRKLVLEDKVFAILNGLGTPTHTGVLDFLKTNRVPDLFVASGSRSWDQPSKYPTTFGFNTDYTVEGKILATHIKATYAGKKVCFFGQDDDFGRDSLVGVEQVLGAGAVVAKEKYVTSNTNVAPQIGALKAAGCEVVVLATVPGFTALSMGTAARIGFKPQWVVSNVGSDYQTLAKTLGAGKVLLEGMIGVSNLPSPVDAADPWTAMFKKIHDQYNSAAPFNGNAVYGMSVAYLFVQSLQAAGKDLTREGLIAAVEKGGFKGPWYAPLRFSKDDHSGFGGHRLTKVSGDSQEFFGPVYETDSESGPVNEYGEQRPTPPANSIPSA